MSGAGAQPSHVRPQTDVPLSPTSLTSASAQPKSSTSPTSSSIASATNTSTSPPYSNAFTPLSSVPMSAQTSQTSVSAHTSVPPSQSASMDVTRPQDSDTPMSNYNVTQSLSAKRKFDGEDEAEDTPSKRAKVEETPSAAQRDTKLDLGPLYCVGRRDYTKSRPHASQDLISLYRLGDMAASVARFDSVTGDKINRLRKSYEGKIKDLPGRNKGANMEGVFMDMIDYPDEEWQIQRVAGRDISKGATDDLLAKLDRATKMESGRLPGTDHDTWKNAIHLDEQPVIKTEPGVAAQPRGGGQSPAHGVAQAAPSSTRASRGVKRSYQDDSFEGYGDGFGDDTNEAHSPKDGDEGGGGSRKKKRRVGVPIKPKSRKRL